MAGNVGNLPDVENMDIQYAQSCVLTPCDFPFARDGIAADTTPNVEMVAIADLQLDSLANARRSEEHTSELQSLMRISYAVFCLKKKNNKQQQNHQLHSIHISN